MQRDLPRPTTYRAPSDKAEVSALDDSPLAVAERLIQEELARLIMHDAVAYPPVGSKVAGSTANAIPLDDLSDDYLALAKGEVDQELSGPESKEQFEAFTEEFDQVWDEIQQEIKEMQQIGLAHQFAVSLVLPETSPWQRKMIGKSANFFFFFFRISVH